MNRLLVIDDEPHYLRGIEYTANRYGCEVIYALTIAEGVTRLNSAEWFFKVVCDLRLPFESPGQPRLTDEIIDLLPEEVVQQAPGLLSAVYAESVGYAPDDIIIHSSTLVRHPWCDVLRSHDFAYTDKMGGHAYFKSVFHEATIPTTAVQIASNANCGKCTWCADVDNGECLCSVTEDVVNMADVIKTGECFFFMPEPSLRYGFLHVCACMAAVACPTNYSDAYAYLLHDAELAHTTAMLYEHSEASDDYYNLNGVCFFADRSGLLAADSGSVFASKLRFDVKSNDR